MKWLMARVLALANLFQGQWACVADYGKHSLSRRTRLRSSERLGAPLHCTSTTAGGWFFHSKGTWGCAAHKGILFWTSSLAKGILFGNLVEFSPGKGMLFGNSGQRTVKIR